MMGGGGMQNGMMQGMQGMQGMGGMGGMGCNPMGMGCNPMGCGPMGMGAMGCGPMGGMGGQMGGGMGGQMGACGGACSGPCGGPCGGAGAAVGGAGNCSAGTVNGANVTQVREPTQPAGAERPCHHPHRPPSVCPRSSCRRSCRTRTSFTPFSRRTLR